MLSLTRKTDYALVALAYLGQRQAEVQPMCSAREIADRFDMPLPLLMNILKELAKARIVSSTRGSSGGYSLAMEPEQVTLLEIVTATEGPMRLAQCCSGLPIVGQEECRVAVSETCPIRGPMRHLHERLTDFMAGITLAELMEEEKAESGGWRAEKLKCV